MKKKTSDHTILVNIPEDAIDSSTLEGYLMLAKLKEYKEKSALIEKEEARLEDLKEEIKKTADRSRLMELNDERIKTANRITVYSRRLLQLREMKFINDLLEREKEKVRKEAEEKGREALTAYRDSILNVQKEQISSVRTKGRIK